MYFYVFKFYFHNNSFILHFFKVPVHDRLRKENKLDLHHRYFEKHSLKHWVHTNDHCNPGNQDEVTGS